MYWKSVKLEDCEKDYVILNFYCLRSRPVDPNVVRPSVRLSVAMLKIEE